MGKSSRSTGKMSVGRGGRLDISQMFSEHKRSWPMQIMGLLLRWRAELAVIVVTWLVWSPARGVYESDQVLFWSVFAGVPVLVMAIPVTRRGLCARLWCVVDRHRLRTCLRESKIRTMNMSGSLPFMLWARPTKTGERVWLWVRAGSSGADIEYALEYIAPACFAREARVTEVRKLSTLVAVELVRRDPLGTRTAVANPLSRLTSLVTGQVQSEGTEPIAAATVTDITMRSSERFPLPEYPATPQRKNKTVKTDTPAQQSGPAVMVNGEDLSDYID